MKRYLILLIFILSFSSTLYAQTPPKYIIDCNLDLENHTLHAKQKVEFRNETNQLLKSLYFHIYPNRAFIKDEINFIYKFAGYFKINPFPKGFDAGGFRIDYIKYGNKDVTYSIEGEDNTILKVHLPSCLKPGQTIKLELKYDVKIPHMLGRFGWHKNIIALNRWYPILSVIDKQGWHNYPFYLFHQPYFSTSSSYKVNLTLPKNQVVVHSGILKEVKSNNDNTKTLFIKSDLPIRDFSLAISQDYKLKVVNIDGITINSYYLLGDAERAQEAANFAKDLMQYYGKNFGKYPYKEFSIAPVYLAYGGHEASNMIFIDTRVYKLPQILDRYFDFLISHETGHQWFYNLIGSDEYKETFMDEGINSYWLIRHLENKYGKDARVLLLPKGIKWLFPNFTFKDSSIYRYMYLAKNGLDRPIIGKLSSFREPASIFALTYGKGAAVISMLGSIVGNETLDRIMHAYATEFKFKNAMLEDFIKIVNRESKKDLNWFFRQFLTTDKKCDYSIKEVRDNRIILENKGKIIMPLKINVVFKDGEILQKEWDGIAKNYELIIKGNKQIQYVFIHPDAMILDIDKTNNHWPRKLNKKVVPLYHPLYEIPVFMPNDSYNLTFGPTIGNGIGAKASLQKPYDNIFYLSSRYDFDGEKLLSSLGFNVNHLFGRQIKFGVSIFQEEDYGDEEDVEGGKVYLRRELWPASYGLTQGNDHITLYLVRDRKFAKSAIEGLQDPARFRYKMKHEAIIGVALDINRQGPYPDPVAGYKISLNLENAGHFLGAQEAFWRNSLSLSRVDSFIPGQKIAYRVKYGWGYPRDRYLFNLGGPLGLRGYDRKDIQGSNSLLASIEYRIDLLDDMNIYLFDNILHFDGVGAVGFFDVGKSWFTDFDNRDFKKNAGLGLRLKVNLGAFLEKIILRFDTAWPINDSRENDAKFWFGLNHPF